MSDNCQILQPKRIKALVLLSGGLDSMLAVKILQEQGIEVAGLSFKSHFFDTQKAKIAAANLGIRSIEIDFSSEHLEMVKNPAHGYGKNMNPCIDCHGMMLKKASELLGRPTSKRLDVGRPSECGYDFIATGEVLGQRPMSQNKEALITVAKISGLENSIVRPLSAKLLDETMSEKEGIVKRHRLLDISGRSRERQMELAIKYGIKEYPSPAGGCLLTDPEFSQRLIKLFDNWKESTDSDVELIKKGRVFWINDKAGQKIAIIIGRDQKDNEGLATLAKKDDIIIELKDCFGPTTIIRSANYKFANVPSLIEIDIPAEMHMSELRLGEPKTEEEIINIASLLTGYYSTKARSKRVNLQVQIIN